MSHPTTSLSDITATYWPILAVSFLVSLAATPLCRFIAREQNIVDRPDHLLKPHTVPIPYLGGAAIFLGWFCGVMLAILMFDRADGGQRAGPAMHVPMMLGILASGLVVVALGLFDDLKILSAKFRLIAVTMIAVGFMAMGLGDDTVAVILRSTGFQPANVPRWLMLAYSAPLTLLITLGACNATNLIDGVDGLCSGVLGIISAGFLILAVHLHVWDQWNPLDVQRVVLSLAMMGAALGFLPYNRNPATIFMGDAGSMLLGLNAAILLLLFAESRAVRWFLAALMVFGLPLSDLLLAIARRWRNEKPLMQGDRSHFYDQLLDRGMSVKRVVGVSYALAAAFALMGCVSIFLRTRYIILLYMLAGGGVLFLIARFQMVRRERENG